MTEAAVIFAGTGTAATPPESVDLRGYPGLAYAPRQWGEGVRLAHNGAGVAELCADSQATRAMAAIDRLAAGAGVPIADAMDALRYGRAAGLI